MLRFADLALLALALPVFLLAGLPLAGYAVAAGAWLAQRIVHLIAERRANAMLAAGDRRHAMTLIAGTTLGRVWLVALAVLIVGLGQRDAGLAAAVLCAVLFTVFLATQALGRFLAGEEATR